MRKIILATNSQARKKIFKIFGLNFITVVSNVKERRISLAGKTTCEKIVINNAKKKAVSLKRRFKKGVIIAADTLIVQGTKVYGKPKNISDARDMLKVLSSAAHFVYTGICVVDLDKNKCFTDFDKTKVVMEKLTLKDIDNYFKKINPLSKAGSFDIFSQGAWFVKRIEGCFYNVVGLPLNKLYRLLRKVGVFIVVGLCLSIFSGCATEYNIVTQNEELIYYSTEKEVAIGRSVSRQIEKEFELSKDTLLNRRLVDIGKKMAAVSDRKDLNYVFRVLDEDELNAFALPGGYIYVNRGLMEKADDDELACVIGHEIGHINAKHSIKRLQSNYGYTFLMVLASFGAKSNEAMYGVNTIYNTLMLGYSRKDELLADTLSVRYAKKAGFDASKMISFLGKLHEIHMKKPAREYSYVRTHPYTSDRVRIIKQELGMEIEFSDYINKEDDI